jgi:quercetin dioxygenase-like cupin family protein
VMRFPRTYADADGGSHFDEVDEALAPTAFVPTKPPLALSPPRAATAAVFCQLAPGWDGSWHPSPHRQFAVTLSGEWAITVSDGECRRFGPGEFLLLDDLTGRGHSSAATGPDDSVLLLVWLAEDGEAPAREGAISPSAQSG